MTTAAGAGPPPRVVGRLVGPLLAALEWHPQVDSTNTLAAEAAARGVPEIHAVVADNQTHGRGRMGRRWEAPAGSSLLLSLVVRPRIDAGALPLLPLVAGLALAEAVDGWGADAGWDAQVALKWPNDLLVAGRKAAGILVEGAGAGDAVVVGIGVNVDWRGLPRPAGGAPATSLAEQVGQDVERWDVLEAVAAAFAARYAAWVEEPHGFLDEYRLRCATLGQAVRVSRVGAPLLAGVAAAVGMDGTLALETSGGLVQVSAGDVEHVRPAAPDAGGSVAAAQQTQP